MSRYKSISTYVDVDIDLSEWDTDELIEELNSRNDESFEGEENALYTICDKIKLGQSYEQDLRDLIYHKLGKIV
jgi:hypothetical protein